MLRIGCAGAFADAHEPPRARPERSVLTSVTAVCQRSKVPTCLLLVRVLLAYGSLAHAVIAAPCPEGGVRLALVLRVLARHNHTRIIWPLINWSWSALLDG